MLVYGAENIFFQVSRDEIHFLQVELRKEMGSQEQSEVLLLTICTAALFEIRYLIGLSFKQ